MEKEYYIQGDPARAEEIKSAFEEKGCTLYRLASKCDSEDLIYYSLNGIVRGIKKDNLYLFEAHPGYKELPLSVKSKPKFKVGDWLWDKEKGEFPVLIAGYDEEKGYLAKYNIGIETYFWRDIIENEYRLWEISDARNGDVLVDKYGNVGIYEKMSGLWWYSHIYFGCDGHLHGFEADGCHIQKNAKPATSEQRDLLFAKMKEAGYTWDSDKKKLKKVPKHYEITNFKAGMAVLVRDGNEDKWTYLLFSDIDNDIEDKFIAGASAWKQCIPFDGNEKLLGTTDQCDERYINW